MRGRRASRTWSASACSGRRRSPTLFGLETVGAALGLLVAALALLAATTGFCAGCTAYKVGYRLTGRRFVSCPIPPALPE